MINMKNDFSKNIIAKATEQKVQKIDAEKRKKHFQEIGRKGGLKKKSEPQLMRVISFRTTEIEYQLEIEKAQKVNLKLSTFARMVYQGKVLKIHEFNNDELLLEYGNNFIRIKNLLRHREWSVFSNKNKILHKIEEVLELISQYLYSKKEGK